MKSHFIKTGLLFIALPIVIISTRIVTANQKLILLTPQEAEQLNLTDEEWKKTKRMLRAPISKGPVISLVKPALKDAGAEPPSVETISPVHLVVHFKERNAAVDMNSLQVYGKKGILKMSLTDRLKPYIKGTTLEAPDVQVPKGRFLVVVSVQDVNGQKTQKSYRLLIINPADDS